MNPPMQYTLSGLHLTQGFESCRLQAYRDQRGIWTIGYGHTRGVFPGMVITQAQADALLMQDVQFATLMVNYAVRVPLTQDEFNALVDFCFNIGGSAFAHSTLVKILNTRNYAGAAAQFERWDFVAGKQCAGLLRRREAEVQEFDGGIQSQISG